MIRDEETLALLLASVSRFVRERLVPNEDLVAESDAIPEDLIAEMRDLGLFGLCIPEEYGGAGFSFLELAVLLEEMGRAVFPAPFLSTVVMAANAFGLKIKADG